MYTASIPIGWLYGAMAAALLLAMPLGVLFVNWIGTLAFGAIRLRAPMLFALGAISTLSFGLAAELMHAVIPVNWLLGDTADATAATGYVFVGGPVLGGLAALYYWFPKMTGRTMGEGLAGASLLLIIVGAHLTLIPMALAGLEGQPVDVYKYFDVGVARHLQPALDDRRLRPRRRDHLLARSTPTSASAAAPAPATIRGAATPRVARALASPAPQLRRRSRRPQRGAAARHPRGGRAARGARARALGRAVGEHRAGSLSRMNGPGGTRAGEGGDELRRFRRLADLTAITTFLLIIVGGVVRVSDSGLGCGPGGSGTEGWPLCGGEVIPLVGDVNRIIEFSHRVLAAVVVALIALLAWRAYKGLRDRPLAAPRLGRGRRPGPGAGGARRAHGREQPRTRSSSPPTSASRWSCSASSSGSASGPAPSSPPPRASAPAPAPVRGLRPYAAVAAVLLLAAIVAGGYMAGTEEEGVNEAGPNIAGAHLACGEAFPTCLDGRILPFGESRLTDIHLTHRVLRLRGDRGDPPAARRRLPARARARGCSASPRSCCWASCCSGRSTSGSASTRCSSSPT